ncbi:MAG: DNA polymerase/3'-5' exonuclease PolX [Candidatus Omnitrophica bacterium]|nr:DNA polymerase/3'-5' exonuclease PolX [Candidatus Omnitrophota bacterium]
MDNKEIARLFSEIAELMEIKGENAFKIRAYQKAVRTIESFTEPLQSLHAEGKLESIEGIGKGLAGKIAEALEKGSVQQHQELLKSLPEGLLDLLDVPGMGPKKVKLVYDELNITSIDELKRAAEAGALQSLPGMGKKSEEKILKGIEHRQQTSSRFLIGVAAPIAQEILDRIRQVKGVKQAQIAGSLRRGKETAGDVDILVAAKAGKPIMEEFLATPAVRDVLAKGDAKSSLVLNNGLQVDLRIVPEASFGAALQYFTGAKEHNVKLRARAVKQKLKVNEYGVFKVDGDDPIAGSTEEDVYASLGLVWIPPELREGLDEIELAEKDQLPALVERQDIRSALHNHTTASDGLMRLDELAAEAKRRGYEYIAVTDHSGGLGVAGGLNADRLKKQMDEIHGFNEKKGGVPVLTGSEVDIRVDGRLDFPDDLLAQLDVVIAAVHGSLDQPREKITKRICDALENPYVDILSHPSGRLIGRRPPMDVDWEALFAKAAETGVVLEINAHYMRLDLKDQHIREAMKYGALFSIDTDTHAAADFDNLDYGVRTARRGRLAAKDVINCLPMKDFMRWKKKHRRQGRVNEKTR